MCSRACLHLILQLLLPPSFLATLLIPSGSWLTSPEVEVGREGGRGTQAHLAGKSISHCDHSDLPAGNSDSCTLPNHRTSHLKSYHLELFFSSSPTFVLLIPILHYSTTPSAWNVLLLVSLLNSASSLLVQHKCHPDP